MNFSEANHCVEPLKFTLAVERYKGDYETAELMPEVLRSQMDSQLNAEWKEIIHTFVLVGSPLEINVPGEARDRLLKTPCGAYGSPELFDGLLKSCKELMQENSYLNFVQQARMAYNASQGCQSPETDVFSGGSSPTLTYAALDCTTNDSVAFSCPTNGSQKTPNSTWHRMSKHFGLRKKNRGSVAA